MEMKKLRKTNNFDDSKPARPNSSLSSDSNSQMSPQEPKIYNISFGTSHNSNLNESIAQQQQIYSIDLLNKTSLNSPKPLDTNKLFVNYLNQIKFPFGSSIDLTKQEEPVKRNVQAKDALDLSLPNRSRLHETVKEVIKSKPSPSPTVDNQSETKELTMSYSNKRKLLNNEEESNMKKVKVNNSPKAQKVDSPIELVNKKFESNVQMNIESANNNNLLDSNFLNAAYFLQLAQKAKTANAALFQQPQTSFGSFMSPHLNTGSNNPFDASASLAFLNQLFTNYSHQSFFSPLSNNNSQAVNNSGNSGSKSVDSNSGSALQLTTFASNSSS